MNVTIESPWAESIFRRLPEGIPVSLQAVLATIVLGTIYSVVTKDRPVAGIPIASLDGKTPRKSWLWHGRELVRLGDDKYSGGPYQVLTGTGPKIILPNRFADEIKNNPQMFMHLAFKKDFFIEYPGFDGHRIGLENDWLIQTTVRTKLTQSLNLITGDLVDETTASLQDVYGGVDDWETRSLREDVIEVVARLSSRVFLGLPLCRNRRWLEITKSYTVDSFTISFIMRAAPWFMRPLAYWLNPMSARLRKAVRDARNLIDPEVKRRLDIVDKAKAAGEKPPKMADTIGWMYDVANGANIDYVAGQLSLSMAAIHTTTETTCAIIMDLCDHPEVVPQLREEVIRVIGEGGWAKTSLYKLKLMDSFIKEGQRVRPMGTTSMNRLVTEETTLSDGTVLPKGVRIMVATNFMDPELYPEPEKFDAARFLKMREREGEEHSWQLVTTTPAHMFFGHGQHACPGRFFAANEVKILLCHLLLKYDFRWAPGEKPVPMQMFETVASTHQDTKVQMRRRVPEIDLDTIEVK
ncbi:cytochrome P450 [Microdochium trichocladiopsis]|uniref:Cytochrome P450 n=1 Tax=Microdochium trichocladiopsis TaxID=1682393 RepID=A0A9P8YHS3_9PEZI|nr:cytochrome P450 [Microdochium trichocladiopsis]KAH7040188.1 cytochrome P450 [Microdochium trichocladiopsis]